MAKKLKVPVASFLEHMGDGHEEYWFECPGGCGSHRIIVKWGSKSGRKGPEWSFNGNLECPTFQPSLLVQWENETGKRVCHSFITNGKIQFCADSTHSLSGKTVDLVDAEPWPEKK